MKILISYLYIAAIVSALFGILFSILPLIRMGQATSPKDGFSFELFMNQQGPLLLISFAVLIICHIGIHTTKVFDESSAPKAKKQALNNLSGTPWDPIRKD